MNNYDGMFLVEVMCCAAVKNIFTFRTIFICISVKPVAVDGARDWIKYQFIDKQHWQHYQEQHQQQHICQAHDRYPVILSHFILWNH